MTKIIKRILIVDDHAVVRGGLRQFLANTDDLEIAAEAETGFDALALIPGGEWDLVLLDMSLPDLSGLEVLKRIKRMRPNLPVLVFSMFSGGGVRHAGAGCRGLRLPEQGCRHTRYWQLSALLLMALATSAHHWPSNCFQGGHPVAQKAPHETLSRREMEVLLLLSKGMGLILNRGQHPCQRENRQYL